jgi:hypothetical protein
VDEAVSGDLFYEQRRKRRWQQGMRLEEERQRKSQCTVGSA